VATARIASVARRALGQQRDRVLRVLVLGQHHDAGAGVPLAHLLGRVDALPLERRWHADVGHQHLGPGLGHPAHHAVEVARHPEDLQVLLSFDEGAHAFPHDQVVVRQEDPDRGR
jgi:hypothetical protein